MDFWFSGKTEISLAGALAFRSRYLILPFMVLGGPLRPSEHDVYISKETRK